MHSRVFYVFIAFKVIFILLHIKKTGLDLVSASTDMFLVVVSNHMYDFQGRSSAKVLPCQIDSYR